MNLAERNNITLQAWQECVQSALNHGNTHALELLAQKGIITDLESCLTSKNSTNNRNPFIELVYQNNLEALSLLLQLAEKHAIDVSTIIFECLTTARQLGHIDVLAVLLPRVPNLDIAQFLNDADSDNKTLLMRLVMSTRTSYWKLSDIKQLINLANKYSVALERVCEALAIAQEHAEQNKDVIELLQQLQEKSKCE